MYVFCYPRFFPPCSFTYSTMALFVVSLLTITISDLIFISCVKLYTDRNGDFLFYKILLHWNVSSLAASDVATSGPVFCLLLRVSSGYAQPITGQVTEVTCPVIGWAQPEITPSKRQERALVQPHHLSSLLVSWNNIVGLKLALQKNNREQYYPVRVNTLRREQKWL